MALHGNIEVNRVPIGTWVATRQEAVVVPDVANTYECRVDDLSNDRHAKFVISHYHRDGAIVLATKVLLRAHELIGTSPQVREDSHGSWVPDRHGNSS